MKIMIDIDGTINDLIPKVIEMYNTRNNKSLSMDDITMYNLFDCLKPADANGICTLFKQKELWDSLKPLVGSQNGIKKLINSGHQVYLATATSPINFEWKIKWLENYFPFFDTNNVIRIMDKSLLNGDVLIDDCLEQLTKCMCERICLDYAWNRDTNKDYVYDIYRCKSWDQIVKTINDIERKMEQHE